MKKLKKSVRPISDYDNVDTTSFINPKKRLQFKDLGLKLPESPPTKVISIRLPSKLLNQIQAIGSNQDIPYQALIKLMLAEAVAKMRKRAA